MGSVRHLAVWVAAIAFFALGAVWYTVLARPWLAGIGKTMEQLQAESGGSPLPYITGFLAILVMCYLLAWLLGRLDAQTFAAGLRTGAAIGVGFIGAMLVLNYGFEARSPTLWLIYAGYAIVGLTIAGAIIGGWKRHA